MLFCILCFFLFFFIVNASRICKRFLLLFSYDFCIVNWDLSYIWGFEFVSVFVMICYCMVFYGTYVRKVVGKATRERGCCMTNVGIRCYVNTHTHTHTHTHTYIYIYICVCVCVCVCVCLNKSMHVCMRIYIQFFL